MEIWVLRRRRKVSEDGQVQTSAESEFQTVGAETLKPRVAKALWTKGVGAVQVSCSTILRDVYSAMGGT